VKSPNGALQGSLHKNSCAQNVSDRNPLVKANGHLGTSIREQTVRPKYIFIVGLSRTGGKWTVHILENCQERNCYIIRESFFLGRTLFRPGVRQKMRRIGDMALDSNVHKLIDYMYSGKFGWYGWSKLIEKELSGRRDELLQRILNSDRSDKEIYQILLRIQAGVAKNTVLGDKSGAHLYYVPTLLEWFPEAKIIHTFRDPRAILTSHHKKLLNKRQGLMEVEREDKSQVFFLEPPKPFFDLMVVSYITISWLYAVRLHHKYQKLYPKNYYLLKYEDLVCKREETVKRLCKFLSIQFCDEMLMLPSYSHSSFRLEEGGTGFDMHSLTRWKTYLKPWMKVWLLLWTKRYLKEFGYARINKCQTLQGLRLHIYRHLHVQR
jgi:hypothetical protein